ncbi:cyclic nucleotide-binding domain-containing protein [Sphingobacterium faecium]|uniref:Crp/Fnr family transcriptional regulator n=1 Tax=Sphingobacterium faecium TaxID=34087 RepID=UPI001292B407|nr:Crp/Fnr family transcriptional regulator [Sphingobacterium faecium]MQP28418.1 cyclic nucleotide-binding domain-containing protein [Sphingobacterium faecium]
MELLLNHIKKYVELNDEQIAHICKSFYIISTPKRKLVLNEGETCTHLYFVVKGCLRMFYFDEKGVEQTVQFALENWWMTDIDAFNKREKSTFSIQAIEKTTLIGIRKINFDLLLTDHPSLEKYFRMIYERAYSASLYRMKYARSSKEDFYYLFCSKYPDFIQRVPQKLLASFLGFTPEYLSELRKKNSKVRP